MNTTPVLCTCDSWHCDKSIQIPIDIALEIRQKGYVVIVDGCRNGPSSTDALVEKRDGYALYKEQ